MEGREDTEKAGNRGPSRQEAVGRGNNQKREKIPAARKYSRGRSEKNLRRTACKRTHRGILLQERKKMKETNAAEIKVLGLNEKKLVELSGQRLLSLDLAEMKAAQDHFEKQGRNPTDIELETLAQTWSEDRKRTRLN